MGNSTSANRSQRDAGFQRSQRRPDDNGREGESNLRETFESAVANRFGEEIGVDLHDAAWKAIPDRYKKVAGIVGAAKLAIIGTGNLIAESTDLIGKVRQQYLELKRTVRDQPKTAREANQVLEDLFQDFMNVDHYGLLGNRSDQMAAAGKLAKDLGISGQFNDQHLLEFKLVISECLLRLFDILTVEGEFDSSEYPTRIAVAISRVPSVMEVASHYLAIETDPHAQRWIQAKSIEFAASSRECSKKQQYQYGLMAWLARQCDINMERPITDSNSNTILQCVGLISLSTHGAMQIANLIDGHCIGVDSPTS